MHPISCLSYYTTSPTLLSVSYGQCTDACVSSRVPRDARIGLIHDTGRFNPLAPNFKKYILTAFNEKCISEVERIGSINIFHLSKL